MKSRKFYFFSTVLLAVAFLQNPIAAQTPTPTPETTATPEATATPQTTPIPEATATFEAAATLETTPTPEAAATPETPKVAADLIHPGDLIEVDVVGSTEYDWRGTINPEGFLDGVDFVENPIFALCRAEEDVAADVARAYSKLLRDPKVSVRVLDRSNRPLSILYGAIKNPQRFQIKRKFHLNELIIIGGGLTERASGEIQIFRQQNLNCQTLSKEESDATAGRENRERFVPASQSDGSKYINVRVGDLLAGKKEANPQILSGDIVTILEADSIYVIGGVVNPKQISARTQMTLSRAVASAGGVSKDADPKKVTIYRREAGETKIIGADLEKIKTDPAADLILQAFDIVEVERTGREKRKFAPVLKIAEDTGKKTSNLPLRIID